MFARKNIEVAVAGRRPPEALASQAKAIGPTVIPRRCRTRLRPRSSSWLSPLGRTKTLQKAANWQGKIVIDVTNAYGVPPEELGGLPSSVVIAQALTGARLVKAFNHLAAPDPRRRPGRQGRAAGHIPVERRRKSGHASGGVG
jgi:predicted dinucleotide-binding enzyme